MTEVGKDLLFAWRATLRRPGVTLIAVLTLALGIGGATASFSALHAVLHRPLPYPEPERLVLGRGTFKTHRGQLVSAHNYVDYRDQSRSFAAIAAATPLSERVVETGGSRPEHLRLAWVSDNFFQTLGVEPVVGRAFVPDDQAPGGPGVVVISRRYWERRFARSPAAVGSTLNLAGTPCTVVGVMPEVQFPSLAPSAFGLRFVDNADAWSVVRLGGRWADVRRFTNFFLIGRLRDGVSLVEARAEAASIFAGLAARYPEDNTDKGVELQRLRTALAERHGTRMGVLLGAAGLLLLLAPALRSSRLDLARDLRTPGHTVIAGGSGRAQAALVVAQVAFSCVLLVVSGLLVRSFLGLLRIDAGYDPRNLVAAELSLTPEAHPTSGERVRLLTAVLDGARGLPGVETAGLISHLPLEDHGESLTAWPRGTPPEAQGSAARSALVRTVVPGTFAALGIPLLRGRDLLATDGPSGPLVGVISQDAAEAYFPGLDPVGQHLEVDVGRDQPADLEVVGVAGAARLEWIGSEPERAIYLAYSQSPEWRMRLVLRPAAPLSNLLDSVQQVVWRHDPDLPVEELVSMASVIRRSLGFQRRLAVALSVFAATALTLASLGLAGLLAFWVGQRRGELGLRLALGGHPRQVFLLVARRGLRLTALGVGLGLVAAAACTRLVASQLHGVDPLDPIIFVGAPLVLVVATALALWTPARRAAAVDPSAALRSE